MNFQKWVSLGAALLFSTGAFGVENKAPQKNSETALGQSEVGRRIAFGVKRCGENGVYAAKATVQVIVVGNSGRLNCIIRITEKLLRASDFRAGYACVNAHEAKKAEIVAKNDKRALRERGYAEQLAIAEKFANGNKVPLEVIYIVTNQGPPHPEPRCKKMLQGA